MTLSPIALFVYNRSEHTRKTVEALQKNNLAEESELFIFSDGYKNDETKSGVEEVRNYIKNISGFKKIEIIEKSENFGLAKSIISGVTEVVNRFGKVIVLEDDLQTSPYFLEYMNKALDLYEAEENVISIHGYLYPVKNKLPETFFIKGADCWGWATWQRGWQLFEPNGQKLLNELESKNLTKEFDFGGSYPYTQMLMGQIAGRNNSWAIRWYASAFLNNKLTLYPGRSLVKNIGMDGSGRHSVKMDSYDSDLALKPIILEKQKAVENILAKKEITKYYASLKPRLVKRIIDKIKRICSKT
jgi:hypothetical protein